LARNVKKKLAVNNSITLILSLHYLWNAEVVVWLLTTMNSHCVAHASAQKITEVSCGG